MIRHIRRTDKAVVKGWAGLLAGQQGVCLVNTAWLRGRWGLVDPGGRIKQKDYFTCSPPALYLSV